MKIKNKKGITMLSLVIAITVLALLTTVAVSGIGSIIDEVKKENIKTNMLLVQAKAKVVNEKVHFNSEENTLAGTQLSLVSSNSKVTQLLTDEVISSSEDNYDKYYYWDKTTIENLDVGIAQMDDGEFYIVNYVTEEVIYSEGYKHTDGETYYKLSEINDLGD